MSVPTIDPTTLPAAAQKILDPSGPPQLKAMAAKGLMPGVPPGAILAVVVMLSLGAGGEAHAETAKKTLEKLPPPLINGALALPDLHPAVLDALGPIYATDAAISEKVLHHPAIVADTVVAMAAVGTEGVCELIATNEERMLANPAIIEKLYMNKHCRMSTADRILELAVRNDIELGIPAFAQAKQAIQGELIAEPTEEPSFDDTQFLEAGQKAQELQLAEGEDTHELNPETGQEEVTAKARPLHAVWAEMRAAAKIRFMNIATLKKYDEHGREIGEERFDVKAIRMLGIRDANPLVAVSALATPGISDAEIVRIAGLRNVAEDVLREIAINREWTRHYMVKFNLVANPRTPFGHASKFVLHLRESDLKSLAKSKEVSGAIQTAAKQQLSRKGK
ncbi:MAG: hypothetical protein KIS78_03735 [Labilithrix sp.]|nr:hypothetical protein [Labilithrix sp.]MCW5831547.1 hypothetical protein [Labilithrix sp.]